MRAGRLTERLVFEQQATSQNAIGENVGTWSTFATVWGEAEPLRGREFFASGQMHASAEVRFRIRYRADIDETMRIDWRGKKYEIVAPPMNVGGRRVELEIMAASGIRNGG